MKKLVRAYSMKRYALLKTGKKRVPADISFALSLLEDSFIRREANVIGGRFYGLYCATKDLVVYNGNHRKDKSIKRLDTVAIEENFSFNPIAGSGKNTDVSDNLNY